MAAASDRVEVDTARPFRSVKEAVAVFGDRILVGNSHSSRHSISSSAATIATPSASANNATSVAATPSPGGKHEASSSSSTMTFSPTPMAETEVEAEAEIIPATVPMYSAPSSPTSLASSPSPVVKPFEAATGGGGALVAVRSIQKLEADVSETRQEVAQLRKRGNEMEMALASLSAQLHRGLSKLAELEADARAATAAARRRSVGGDTDVSFTPRSERWGGGRDRDRLAVGESYSYLPSFSHALSLGEMGVDDADELMGSRRRRKARKVKPIVPLIGDILFSNSRRKSTKEKGDESFYSGDLCGVLGA